MHIMWNIQVWSFILHWNRMQNYVYLFLLRHRCGLKSVCYVCAFFRCCCFSSVCVCCMHEKEFPSTPDISFQSGSQFFSSVCRERVSVLCVCVSLFSCAKSIRVRTKAIRFWCVLRSRILMGSIWARKLSRQVIKQTAERLLNSSLLSFPYDMSLCMDKCGSICVSVAFFLPLPSVVSSIEHLILIY